MREDAPRFVLIYARLSRVPRTQLADSPGGLYRRASGHLEPRHGLGRLAAGRDRGQDGGIWAAVAAERTFQFKTNDEEKKRANGACARYLCRSQRGGLD